MDEPNPWSARYVIWSSLNWLLFLAAVAFLTWGRESAGVGKLTIWAIIWLAAISVAGQFWAAYRLVAGQDEFVRALTVKRGIAAAGATIAITVFWGLAQQFAAAPHVPAWLVYPLFWGMFGVVTPFIRTSQA